MASSCPSFIIVENVRNCYRLINDWIVNNNLDDIADFKEYFESTWVGKKNSQLNNFVYPMYNNDFWNARTILLIIYHIQQTL